MKPDSWEFLLNGETRAFNLANWHEVELRLVRQQERIRLFVERGAGEGASNIEVTTNTENRKVEEI